MENESNLNSIENESSSLKPESIPLPSSPISLNQFNSSPSPTSSNHSIKTKDTTTSLYLDSNDFKSDFATKLQSARQDQKDDDDLSSFHFSNHLIHSTPTDESYTFHETTTVDLFQDFKNRHKPTSRDLEPISNPTSNSNASLSPPIVLQSSLLREDEFNNLSPNLLDSSPSSSSEQASYDSETDTLASKQEIQSKEIPNQDVSKPNQSLESESIQSEVQEPEVNESARNEVIGKLATDLAQQIDKYDKLSYDFGMLRATHASLQSVAIDTADELACLREHTKLLLNGHDFEECNQFKIETEASIQHLNQELNLTRRTICRLHLQLYPAQSPPIVGVESIESDHSSVMIDRHTPDLGESNQSQSDCMTPSSTTSLIPTPVSSTLPDDTNPTEECPVDCQAVENLRAKVASLESQLAECQEARLVSETTLAAFKQVMDPTLMKKMISEPKPSTPRWGLNLLLHRQPSIPISNPSNPEPTSSNQSTPILTTGANQSISHTSSFSFSTPWSRSRSIVHDSSQITSPSSSFRIGKLFGSLVSPLQPTTNHNQNTIPDVHHGDEKVHHEKVEIEDEVEHSTPTNNLHLIETRVLVNDHKLNLNDTKLQLNDDHVHDHDQKGYQINRPTLEIQC